MPSLLHEVLVELFRQRPALAAELVRDSLGEKLPPYDTIELRDANLSQLLPTEYHADLVVVLKAGVPVLGLVVEIQLQRDDDKFYSWPVYAMALRAKLRCPVSVLVIATQIGVAHWADQVITTGLRGETFRPLVIGPREVPYVRDEATAKQSPELAVLSVQAHGREEDAWEVVTAAIAGAATLDNERSTLYNDFIQLALGEAMRARLEKVMQLGNYEPQSPMVRKWFDYGRSRGAAEGKTETLCKLLTLKFGPLPAAVQGRLEHATEAECELWTERFLSATSIDEVMSA
jgi:hypothetical protein